MPRRVELPGAKELFRGAPQPAASPSAPEEATAPGDGAPLSTGRVRHEEKITVYVSSDELLALEQLRLTLRGKHRVAVDRGRIVRAAIAEALADVAEHGADSRLIQRLTQP